MRLNYIVIGSTYFIALSPNKKLFLS